MATAEEILAADKLVKDAAAAKKAAEEKAELEAAGLKEANEADVRAALAKGASVKVQMPPNVSSVNIAGAESLVDDDGFVMLHVKHALHAVESFGGKIVVEAKKIVKPTAPVK